MEETIKTELEAATFRRLVQHLDENKDVQNIDLMNLASFCRNCLSKWYVASAEDKGIHVDYEAARTMIYGMPYEEWKKKYQI
ncbi:MAG: deoxycytidine triphosphate deaminase [Alphaproteobacteria bacterium TMED87]|nr:MAG: deoxycytidine triphosphate deaminase [Alphaproteobacteria bacterium TMED87]